MPVDSLPLHQFRPACVGRPAGRDRQVSLMRQALLWRNYVLIFLLAGIIAGCGNETEAPAPVHADVSGGPQLSLQVNGSPLTGFPDKTVSVYRSGMTVRELLESEGDVVFAEDGQTVSSVAGVTLCPELSWVIRSSGSGDPLKAADWSKPVPRNAHYILSAELAEEFKDKLFSILVVNGGTTRRELNHSYVLPYEDGISVRDLLLDSGMVELGKDGWSVASVKDYAPASEEVWKVKANGKLLARAGVDMKLKAQDEVELVLSLRR